MNSDQGSHFTSPKFIEPFLNTGIKISMDHRGRAFDNIMFERLWHTIKYEYIYIMQYESPKNGSTNSALVKPVYEVVYSH